LSRNPKNTPELENRTNYPPQLFKTGQTTPKLVSMVVLAVGPTCQPVGPICQPLPSLFFSFPLSSSREADGWDPHADIIENHYKNQQGVICTVLRVEGCNMSGFIVQGGILDFFTSSRG